MGRYCVFDRAAKLKMGEESLVEFSNTDAF